MKLLTILLPLLVSAANAKWWGHGGGQGNGGGNGGGGTGGGGNGGGGNGNGGIGNGGNGGGGNGNGGNGAGNVLQQAATTLDVNEETMVLFMREEEKMARDVYRTMYDKWNEAVFSNVADAEQAHMNAMSRMIQRYGLTDPVVNDATGVFQNKELRANYASSVQKGQVSLKDALLAGALIEELDIEDLQNAISATDEAVLDRVYGNLMRASNNHLRAFVRELERLGETYQAQELSQAEVDAILN